MQAVIIIVWAALCAGIAHRRGRNPLVWALIGVVMNVFALLLLVILPDLSYESRKPDGGEPAPDSTAGATQPVIDVTPQQSPPSVAPAEAEWYYVDAESKQQGPLTVDDLRGLLKSGTVKEATYLWSEGMDDWQRLSALPDLGRLLR